MILSSLTASHSYALHLAASSSSEEVSGGVFMLFCFFYCCFILAITIPVYVGLWKVFEKAGQPAWHSLVPYVNNCVVARITGDPWWWGLVPFLNIVPYFKLAKAFGKSDAYGIGIVLLNPIFLPMLGFGSAQLQVEKQPPLF